MSKTKVKVKSKPGMFMKHDIAINARKAQKQSESEFKGRNAKEKSESASTTWKVHEQDELAARPCWRLWTVPDLQKTFDHSDDYVKILQSAQRCKSYGGRNILKPKWRKKWENLRATEVKVKRQSGMPETLSRGLNLPDSKSTKSISTWAGGCLFRDRTHT